MRPRKTARGGFTLLEVLVAGTIMAVAVATLLSALSTSVRNAATLTESDKAAVIGKRMLDGFLVDPTLPRGRLVEGRLAPQTGLDGGWRVRVDPFESQPRVRGTIERVALEMYWIHGASQRVLQLEGFRRAVTPGPGPGGR